MRASGPLVSLAILATTSLDRLKLERGLAQLMAEDQALSVTSDQPDGELVIGGMGELHLEMVVDRLKREFRVEASIGRLQIVYKETVTRAADGEMKYAARIGGRGHYAHVKIHLQPGERGSGCVIADAIIQGTIPAEFLETIHAGIGDALAHGVLAGCAIDDVGIELYDGSYHDVDSSARAFRLAAAMALLNAAKKAGPVLLEPVMQIEVLVDEDYADEVAESLLDRRGVIGARQGGGDMETITARVPLSQMFGYAADLRSRTRGRGTFSMELAGYQPCPPPDKDEGGRPALVREPRNPGPLRESGIALPEPDDDGWRADPSPSPR